MRREQAPPPLAVSFWRTRKTDVYNARDSPKIMSAVSSKPVPDAPPNPLEKQVLAYLENADGQSAPVARILDAILKMHGDLTSAPVVAAIWSLNSQRLIVVDERWIARLRPNPRKPARRRTSRHDRFKDVEEPNPRDVRTNAKSDRDRVLYSSAFRRLGGVTQVVSANDGLIIHNRLTHTLKVAQVARRLAERVRAKTEPATLRAVGGLDPDVVEVAALVHDLGHPPFGHIAEKELQIQCTDSVLGEGALQDSFEGNAQSFRIVARQSVRTTYCTGLNLTRAALNAVLKYPWFRGEGPDGRSREKWGAYRDDEHFFAFARKKQETFVRSAEAEIMDWADDIAYALHDTEDFYRAGLIPLHRLGPRGDAEEQARFLDYYIDFKKTVDRGQAAKDLANAIGILGPRERFAGSFEQRALLRSWISHRIGAYMAAFSLRPELERHSYASIEPDARREIDILKQLTWYYVILRPALASQQAGQRRLIRELFKTFREAALEKQYALFPQVVADRLRALGANGSGTATASGVTRLVVDLIASMTEEQALRIHHKLVGVAPGSVMDQLLHHSIG